MNPIDQQLMLKTVVLERLHFHFNHKFPDFPPPEVEVDVAMRDAVVMIRWSLLGNKVYEHCDFQRVPATWWQHFKQTHFPLWLQARFPIKTRSIKTLHQQQYLNLPWFQPNAEKADTYAFRTMEGWANPDVKRSPALGSTWLADAALAPYRKVAP